MVMKDGSNRNRNLLDSGNISIKILKKCTFLVACSWIRVSFLWPVYGSGMFIFSC